MKSSVKISGSNMKTSVTVQLPLCEKCSVISQYGNPSQMYKFLGRFVKLGGGGVSEIKLKLISYVQ